MSYLEVTGRGGEARTLGRWPVAFGRKQVLTVRPELV